MNTYKLPNGLKLNLGCGPVQPASWVNIDGSNRAWLAKRLSCLDKLLVKLKILQPTEFSKEITFLDLTKGLPYADNTVACIYAGELFEHFKQDDAVKLLAECFRSLSPSGVMRICVPDGPDFWRKYMRLFDEEISKERQQRSAEKLRRHIKMFFDDICTEKLVLKSMGHTHKWQYDEIQLTELFEISGFQEVERMAFHQSRIPGIRDIERSDFLIIEGIK